MASSHLCPPPGCNDQLDEKTPLRPGPIPWGTRTNGCSGKGNLLIESPLCGNCIYQYNRRSVGLQMTMLQRESAAKALGADQMANQLQNATSHPTRAASRLS
ncbi:hypothetical protein CEXT_220031 [Caerostris extrusa]|uniref:Uncharacterized protein n=1 Tax=Caerostris extrusa TaxID=172846 RepID=A0AAV4NE82_CAEEX|nr:hypothetical protein CEXT_220031 [Caerostris extrusa]